MVQRSYRANLTAAEFPMLSDYQGRTVIIPDIDQNFSRQTTSSRNADKDIGIPQAYYMHNIMPIDSGLTSVGYVKQVIAPVNSDITFDTIWYLRDPQERAVFLGHTTSGRNYVAKGDGVWLQTGSVSPSVGNFISVAHVNGQSYIYFGGVGCYRYNYDSNVLAPVTLTGLVASAILGITAAQGYMVAWSATQVFWSSTIDATDFVPALKTGAGGGGVQAVKGAITACLSNNSGFIIYTKRNAVAALFTSNVQFPFTYKEINGSGGLDSPELVAYNGNNNSHCVYSTSGLQDVNAQNANIIFPQVTDFLSGYKLEDFDELLLDFQNVILTAPLMKKVTLISNRYIVLSYGVTALKFALIYDIALGRWGKIKFEHVDCFEFTFPSGAIVDAVKRSIGFLQSDGSIYTLVISNDTSNSAGVVITGKYQLDRNSYLSLQEIHVESAQSPSIPRVTVMTSIDGKNTVKKNTALAINSDGYRRYNCRTTGLNHSIIFTGGFQLHSLVLKFTVEGAVR